MRSSDVPELSVVIPTHRQRFLEGTLEALAGQVHDHRFEVVIVENGVEQPASLALSDQYSRVLDVEYIHEPRPGLNRARNIGADHARGDVIAMTDDDCRPAPDWVHEILTSHRHFPAAGVIGGRCMLEFEAGPPAWLAGQLRAALSEVDWSPWARELTDDEWLVGANLSFSREIFDGVGGFDETIGMCGRSLPQLCADEYEFCIRVRDRLGRPVIYQPGLQVTHRIPSSRLSLEYLEGRFLGQGLSSAMLWAKKRPGGSPEESFRRLCAGSVNATLVGRVESTADSLAGTARRVYLMTSALCVLKQIEGIAAGTVGSTMAPQSARTRSPLRTQRPVEADDDFPPNDVAVLCLGVDLWNRLAGPARAQTLDPERLRSLCRQRDDIHEMIYSQG